MLNFKENTGKWTVDYYGLSVLNSKGIGRYVIHNDSKGLEEKEYDEEYLVLKIFIKILI